MLIEQRLGNNPVKPHQNSFCETCGELLQSLLVLSFLFQLSCMYLWQQLLDNSLHGCLGLRDDCTPLTVRPVPGKPHPTLAPAEGTTVCQTHQHTESLIDTRLSPACTSCQEPCKTLIQCEWANQSRIPQLQQHCASDAQSLHFICATLPFDVAPTGNPCLWRILCLCISSLQSSALECKARRVDERPTSTRKAFFSGDFLAACSRAASCSNSQPHDTSTILVRY